MAEVVAESKAIADLKAALKTGHKPLASLPKHLADPAVLGEALAAGLIEFGRPGFIRVATGERHGKEHNYAAKTAIKVQGGPGDWSWTDLSGPARKTLAELLDEEETVDKAIALHVRLARRK